MVIWGIMEIMVQFNVDNRYMKTRISLRLLQTYFVGAMALLAGCQQEMTEPEINQDNNREVPVVLTARQGGGTDARTTYTPSTPEDDGSIAMGVKWDGGEDEMLAYTYYNKEGAGVHFNCLFPVENSISADGKSQDFEGTIIKNDEENGLMHYIFYPCPGESWITKDVAGQTLTVRYPMDNQEQDCTPGNETKHLAAYDIMRAMDFEVESGNTTIEFEHLTSLLYMDFTLPENKAISTIKLISDKAIFGTEYRMKFKVLYSGCESGTDDDKMTNTMKQTLKTDAAGHAESSLQAIADFSNGTMGNTFMYYLVQTKCVQGYSPDTEKHELTFTYADQNTPIIEVTMDLKNPVDTKNPQAPGSATTTKDVPQTGDTTNFLFPILMMLSSVACIIGILTGRKRRTAK